MQTSHTSKTAELYLDSQASSLGIRRKLNGRSNTSFEAVNDAGPKIFKLKGKEISVNCMCQKS